MSNQLQSNPAAAIEWSAYWKCYTVETAAGDRIAIISEVEDGDYVISRLGCVDYLYKGTLGECRAFAFGMMA